MKNLVILSLISLLFGCGDGPKVKQCISSPSEKLFRCFDQEKEKHQTHRPEEMENWICLSPFDSQTFIESCKQKVRPPALNVCIVGSAQDDFLFFCATGRIPFEKTENFTCLQARDQKRVVEYCRRLRE